MKQAVCTVLKPEVKQIPDDGGGLSGNIIVTVTININVKVTWGNNNNDGKGNDDDDDNYGTKQRHTTPNYK